MKFYTKSRALLIFVLFLVIGLSSYLIYKNPQPQILLTKNNTYYLPGQKNNCLWIMQINSNVRDYLGSSSEIKIGIPQTQQMGYLAGRIEVSKDKTLILAFNAPQSNGSQPPIVMTADYYHKKLPIENIRFRWTQSSLVTVVLFKNRNKCLASMVPK